MAAQSKIAPPRRADVFLVSFDPTVGAEIKKSRPALILQNDVANRHSPITIVAAITSQIDESLYPTEVLVRAPEGGLTTDSVVLLNQIRSIDGRRLLRRIGRVSPATMGRVDRALLVSLGLTEV
jgi:mRNA interferase MazF